MDKLSGRNWYFDVNLDSEVTKEFPQGWIVCLNLEKAFDISAMGSRAKITGGPKLCANKAPVPNFTLRQQAHNGSRFDGLSFTAHVLPFVGRISGTQDFWKLK